MCAHTHACSVCIPTCTYMHTCVYTPHTTCTHILHSVHPHMYTLHSEDNINMHTQTHTHTMHTCTPTHALLCIPTYRQHTTCTHTAHSVCISLYTHSAHTRMCILPHVHILYAHPNIHTPIVCMYPPTYTLHTYTHTGNTRVHTLNTLHSTCTRSQAHPLHMDTL